MPNRVCCVMLIIALLPGCATVPPESKERAEAVLKFEPPSSDKAGLYVYRSGSFGGAVKKDIWLNGRCIGESAPNVFFYEQVESDAEHKISTESEFSPNDLVLKAVGGRNYFVRQYIKMGVFVAGAGLELVDEPKGKKDIAKLTLAKSGKCSNN
jgi:hypothetical protein